jgi:ribonuclease HI
MFNDSQKLENGMALGWPSEVIINTDGASRGNPGPASLGVHVQRANGEMVYEYAENLGHQTNNYAEYSAVKKALDLAVKNLVQTLTLRSDSEFLIKQMKGEYAVKSPNIKGLYVQCVELSRKIPKIKFEHVRREQNKRADELANLALDGADFI